MHMGAGECFLKQILPVNNRIQLNDKLKGGKGYSGGERTWNFDRNSVNLFGEGLTKLFSIF